MLREIGANQMLSLQIKTKYLMFTPWELIIVLSSLSGIINQLIEPRCHDSVIERHS